MQIGWAQLGKVTGYGHVQQCLSKSSRATSAKLGSAPSGACVARLAGLPSVPLYKFYSLDGRGRRIEPAIEVDCSDDVAAIAHGDAMQKDAKLEIWEGSRLVIVLPPNAFVPLTHWPVSSP
jgi:hypothetical protein